MSVCWIFFSSPVRADLGFSLPPVCVVVEAISRGQNRAINVITYSTYFLDSGCMDLNLHHPICLYGVVFKKVEGKHLLYLRVTAECKLSERVRFGTLKVKNNLSYI